MDLDKWFWNLKDTEGQENEKWRNIMHFSDPSLCLFYSLKYKCTKVGLLLLPTVTHTKKQFHTLHESQAININIKEKLGSTLTTINGAETDPWSSTQAATTSNFHDGASHGYSLNCSVQFETESKESTAFTQNNKIQKGIIKYIKWQISFYNTYEIKVTQHTIFLKDKVFWKL